MLSSIIEFAGFTMRIVFIISKVGQRFVRRYNKPLIYINTNKKAVDYRQISRALEFRNKSKALIGYDYKKATEKEILRHIKRMCRVHKKISRSQEGDFVVYSFGFPSVPYAFLDGHGIGDIAQVKLLEQDKDTKEVYLIENEKVNKGSDVFSIEGEQESFDSDEVNVLIESSYKIRAEEVHDKDLPLIKMQDMVERSHERLDITYQQECKQTFTKILDDLRVAGIKTVHVYAATRSAVSVTLGMCVQAHHPEVIVYEFVDGSYTWGINIKKYELVKGRF